MLVKSNEKASIFCATFNFSVPKSKLNTQLYVLSCTGRQ